MTDKEIDNDLDINPDDFKIEEPNIAEMTCYALPLTPQDLVAIYKEKEEKEDFVLWVNYVESRQKLSPQHLLIYLANTNFKATMAAVDEELILEYIKSDFMVDCPTLSRIVALIIKHRFQHPVDEIEAQLYQLFNPDQINEFIVTHKKLVDELAETMVSAVPFVLTKIYDNIPEDKRELEVNLKEAVDSVKVVDRPSNCGPNICRLVTETFDAFCLVLSELGLVETYNKQVYNDNPKYFGKDIYHVFCETNITNNIVSFLPPDFLITLGNDSPSK